MLCRTFCVHPGSGATLSSPLGAPSWDSHFFHHCVSKIQFLAPSDSPLSDLCLLPATPGGDGGTSLCCYGSPARLSIDAQSWGQNSQEAGTLWQSNLCFESKDS